MTRYTNVKVKISDGQKQKLQKALQSNEPLTIWLSHEDLNALTSLFTCDFVSARISSPFKSS